VLPPRTSDGLYGNACVTGEEGRSDVNVDARLQQRYKHAPHQTRLGKRDLLVENLIPRTGGAYAAWRVAH